MSRSNETLYEDVLHCIELLPFIVYVWSQYLPWSLVLIYNTLYGYDRGGLKKYLRLYWTTGLLLVIYNIKIVKLPGGLSCRVSLLQLANKKNPNFAVLVYQTLKKIKGPEVLYFYFFRIQMFNIVRFLKAVLRITKRKICFINMKRKWYLHINKNIKERVNFINFASGFQRVCLHRSCRNKDF